MNPTEREQVRLSLLRYMASNRSGYGLPARALRQYLHAEGTSVDLATVEAEMQYLVDKGLAEEIAKTLSPEIRVWRITAGGRDLLATVQGE
mgnify:CR=1